MTTEDGRKLWEILVPRCSDDGIEHSVEHHGNWDEQVRRKAGGITILRAAKGHWINPEGVVFIEGMIPVRVYCDEESIDWVMDFTLDYYDQETVMAYEISSNVRLKNRL